MAIPSHETFGWISIAVGLLVGLAIGPGADRETWLGGYASRPRRLIRLGHIACFGLGFINVLFDRAAASLAPSIEGAARVALLVGSAGLPLACFGAAFVRPLKWALPPFAVLVAAAVVALAVSRLLALPPIGSP